MKNILEFKTLTEFTDYFCDEETCVKHFTAIRFANGEYCPHCGHNEIYKFSNGKRYRCAKCKQDFTIRTGTVFGESKLPLRKWFMAIYLLLTSNKGISSVQLAKQVGVTQKTGWFIDHRIRSAMKQNKGQLFGRVEADETYIGGKAKNMHKEKRKLVGTGGDGKTAIIGIAQRGGDVRAHVPQDIKSKTLQANIADKVQSGSFVYTDEHPAYRGLHRLGFYHGRVQHRIKEWVVGDAHTNTIESFWAMFKRGYHGIYHWMSPKHMQKYVDEFVYRWNRREGEAKNIFSETVMSVANSAQLPYKQLIGKTT
jgi:transposase-like protein